MFKLICVCVLAIVANWPHSQAASTGEIIKQKINGHNYIVGYGALTKVYYLGAERKLDWYAANYDCMTMGWELVKMHDFEEAMDLRFFLHDKGMAINDYWTAGNNIQNNATWVWGIGGKPFTYTNWAKGEPNNDEGNEHCVHTRENTYEWNDSGCQHLMYYVCEQSK